MKAASPLLSLLRLRRSEADRAAQELAARRRRSEELQARSAALQHELGLLPLEPTSPHALAALAASRAAMSSMLAALAAASAAQNRSVGEAEAEHRAALQRSRALERVTEEHARQAEQAAQHAEQLRLDEVAGLRGALRAADEGGVV
ncbi:hypothetical protein [Ruicaihuangia caeni]|uniref:Flagellar FliJ protein n=1 Tax=Ruicaihuangia caeni TaxID=3042517 RepID=A0AAW6T276_9MICO|nr:hypothetical protein [Klugiella sp. YN-L-19]MDI2097882.1 hypothetical protein [Klugiella sp. YN-L-19]